MSSHIKPSGPLKMLSGAELRQREYMDRKYAVLKNYGLICHGVAGNSYPRPVIDGRPIGVSRNSKLAAEAVRAFHDFKDDAHDDDIDADFDPWIWTRVRDAGAGAGATKLKIKRASHIKPNEQAGLRALFEDSDEGEDLEPSPQAHQQRVITRPQSHARSIKPLTATATRNDFQAFGVAVKKRSTNEAVLLNSGNVSATRTTRAQKQAKESGAANQTKAAFTSSTGPAKSQLPSPAQKVKRTSNHSITAHNNHQNTLPKNTATNNKPNTRNTSSVARYHTSKLQTPSDMINGKSAVNTDLKATSVSAQDTRIEATDRSVEATSTRQRPGKHTRDSEDDLVDTSTPHKAQKPGGRNLASSITTIESPSGKSNSLKRKSDKVFKDITTTGDNQAKRVRFAPDQSYPKLLSSASTPPKEKDESVHTSRMASISDSFVDEAIKQATQERWKGYKLYESTETTLRRLRATTYKFNMSHPIAPSSSASVSLNGSKEAAITGSSGFFSDFQSQQKVRQSQGSHPDSPLAPHHLLAKHFGPVSRTKWTRFQDFKIKVDPPYTSAEKVRVMQLHASGLAGVRLTVAFNRVAKAEGGKFRKLQSLENMIQEVQAKELDGRHSNPE